MRNTIRVLGLITGVAVFATISAAQDAPIFADQGANWTQGTRSDFYSRDQGSRMMPLAWLQALRQADGQPFLSDNLARYGYLPNPENANGLPVGFTASGPVGAQVVGMTCSACHTRQIIVAGRKHRIDGGPAIVDFQSLLTDLDASFGRVVSSDTAFAPFAAAVLNTATPDANDVATLRRDISGWYLRFHTLLTRALPSPPWGPARLDAVGMIFNRLTGLDLGQPPNFIIADNIKKADAPVRYPFLWNAAVQDKTQWPGFAENGNDVLGLARNLGEVFGVFGVFEPRRDGLFINFLNNNSANFDGLGRLEELIRKIGPPKWPFALNPALVERGKSIFDRATAAGGCHECHEIAPGKPRLVGVQTWKTPIQNVGTDTREYDVLAWTGKTGVLQGSFIPFVTRPLKETDSAFNMLAVSVIGSIAEHVLRGGSAPFLHAPVASEADPQIPISPDSFRLNLTRLPPSLRDLEGAYSTPLPRPPELLDFHIQGFRVPAPLTPPPPAPARGAYEARVMQGIWATAPYLHNGSVPSLAELLKPAAQRVNQFKIGPAYDITNVGLAIDQSAFEQRMVTTDCSNLNSGNSNCGHEFGTQLSPTEKEELLEYLKSL